MPDRRTVAVLAAALAAGCAIGFVDSRPTWDDTGITAGSVFLAAALLSFMGPRAWPAVALAIGLPVPVFNLAAGGGFGAIAATVIAFAGAAAGALAGRALGGDTVPRPGPR